MDELFELNLGGVDDPWPIFISALLNEEEKQAYKKLLLEYKYCFAWTYKEMSGLEPSVAEHELAILSTAKSVKHAQRLMRHEFEVKVNAEVDKLLEVDFIEPCLYPIWLASIVTVKKKNGQVRICIGYKDLNKACPKDDFPVPITGVIVDMTTGHEALSFMDGSLGYNQIRMAINDKDHMPFWSPEGIINYKRMSFGLKNVGATYQMTMTKMFGEMLHDSVECYVDDLVVKTQRR